MLKAREGKKEGRHVNDEEGRGRETVGARAVEIKKEKEKVYGDALFVTAVCWMKTGPL